MTSLDVEPFYTIADAVKLLKICRTDLFADMRRGRLKSIKRGRSRRIPAEWLNEYRTLLITEGTQETA